jgi:hypothetical protein
MSREGTVVNLYVRVARAACSLAHISRSRSRNPLVDRSDMNLGSLIIEQRMKADDADLGEHPLSPP